MDKLGWVCAVYLGFLGLGIIWNVIWPIVSPRWTAWRRRGPELDFPSMEAPQLVVTLVHGTWGMMSEWTQPGSRFVERLKKALEEHGTTAVQFRRFPWSGGNSFAARKKAQADLAVRIDKVAEEHPSVPHYIVSHSHGGNVALAALRAPVGYDLRMMSVAAVDRLENEGRNLVIVALVGTDLHICDLHIRIFDATENELEAYVRGYENFVLVANDVDFRRP